MYYPSFSLWILLALPGLILGLWAQYKVKSAFSKYSKIKNSRGMTGAEAARAMLDHYGLYNVRIEETKGTLSDHYDPRNKVLRLSPDVGRSPSIAAVGVAAHEAGHALQDAKNYGPLKFRSAIVPAVQFGSWLGPILFMGGFLLQAFLGQFGFGLAVDRTDFIRHHRRVHHRHFASRVRRQQAGQERTGRHEHPRAAGDGGRRQDPECSCAHLCCRRRRRHRPGSVLRFPPLWTTSLIGLNRICHSDRAKRRGISLVRKVNSSSRWSLE